MSIRALSLCAVAVIGLVACSPAAADAEQQAESSVAEGAMAETAEAEQSSSTSSPAEASSETVNPAGTYARTEPNGGTLVISPEGKNMWRLSVIAGGIPNGVATAADCELEAVGALLDGKIAAKLVPFEGEIGSMSEADIGDNPGTITATIKGDTVTLEEDNASSKHCGLNSFLGGDYKKK